MGSKLKNQIMNKQIFFRGAGEYGFVFRFWYGEPFAKNHWEERQKV